MPSLHDTRLLSNLLKTEKDALQAYKHYTLTASSAGAALSAWSVADSADTGDIMDAALRVSSLLQNCTDAQRSYLASLALYRASLKDVLARETALRTVVRDREILVNRLIKIGNKKPKEDKEQEHYDRLEDAQRELRACETFLQQEEIALSHAKRQSFRDALAQRMRSMGELARVMERSAEEAVGILEALGGDEFDEEAFREQHPNHQQYDLASDAGDSIAPSQSASQAMSRASSSSSLSDLANAPPLPDNLQVDPHPPRTRSLSPSRRNTAPAQPASAAASLPRAKSPQPAIPSMPAVPTAPPAISQQVYTERTAGMPTFEIPRAPDLSRRPDESDSESDYGEQATHLGAPSGLGREHRSSHYPLDSPGAGADRANVLRRRAMSDTSSINGEGGGRKRRGSFLGGIAALFRRGGGSKDKSERAGRRYASEGPAGGAGGDDYFGARSRLAGGGGGGAANDAVMRSVMNAGKTLPLSQRRGAEHDARGGESSDDDLPARNLVRHVNDPKARIKAMSDIGRPTSSAPAVSKAVREKRPGLVRKNTSQSRASTVRPMSVAETVQGVGIRGGEGEKRKKKVKKAASDIGVTTSGWSSTTAAPAALSVPKAPAMNGLPPLQGPPPLPTTSSTPFSAAPNGTPAQSGSVTPRPAAPAAETASVGSKKKKKVKKPSVSGGGGGETIVLSAEALGIPTSVSSPAVPSSAPTANGTGGLSRSSTTKTVSSATGPLGTPERKKRKSRAPSFSAVPEERAVGPLPGDDDLALSLPTARSAASPLTAQLPRPDDDPYAKQRPLSTSAVPAPAPASNPAQEKGDKAQAKPVKTLQEKEKKSKRMSALHGVEGGWVAHPASSTSTAPAAPKAQRVDVHEGDESLLSVVDRAEGTGNQQPSRSYSSPSSSAAPGAPPALALAVPAQPARSLPSPSGPLNAALPTAPAAQANQPASLASLPRPPPSDGTATPPQLGKRKSVRLGEISDAQPSTLSPSNSIRSASSAPNGAAKRGILIQRDPSPVPGSAAASLREREASSGGPGAWPSRSSIRQQMDDDTSSEEEGGMSSYRAARKMLGRGTREMEAAMAGKEANGKGKGKARE
ncbi:hypothetical protein JCM10213_007989 [Rhodosporidiobolus nylandii]